MRRVAILWLMMNPVFCFKIQTFKDIIIQKDNQLMEVNQIHEQELFKLAAKSDASADLEQVPTAKSSNCCRHTICLTVLMFQQTAVNVIERLLCW